MKGISSSITANFSTIIGNNKRFVVPRFQRDYSWTCEQWDDLWQDIQSIRNEGEEHYMGYLVLQTNNDKDFYIIDGQQRFATLTILILATINVIKSLANRGEDADNNNQRISQLYSLYIGKNDPVSLAYDNILKLNRNNDPFFADYLVPLKSLNIRGLKSSEKLLRQCFDFFCNKVSQTYTKGVDCAQLVQDIVDKLYFTTIIVNNELNAFKVFETLNARGVQLSSADLLKNYLFSIVAAQTNHNNHIELLETRWAKLTDNIKAEKITEFLRYYWNSKHKIIRSNAVFKTIKAEIVKAQQVFLLIDDLLLYSDVYMALMDFNDELWEEPEVKHNILLLNLFRLKQPYSALMSAKINLSDLDFKKLLKTIIVLGFRYNVICDKNPNDQETPFNELAVNISETKTLNLKILDKIYVEDTEFEKSFAVKSFPYNSRNAKIIRYILGKIEKVESTGYEVDCMDDNASIEHVLPQGFTDNWNINEENGNRLVDRLGNCCLLELSFNRELQNSTYEEKKLVYKQSRFLSTQNIATNYVVWDERAIENRQKTMARIAKGIWRRSK